MPTFHYQALDAEHQLVAGDMQADGVQQAIAELEAAGLTVQAISVVGEEAAADELAPVVAPARPDAPQRPAPAPDAHLERAVIQDHMSKVVAQGRAIAPALRAFSEEMSDSRRRRELCAVCRVLQQGDAAAATAALADMPEYWIPLLSAASSSSDPGRVLREFLDESQRIDELRRQWRLTLAYPAVIAAVALALLLAFAVWIAPSFREIFDDFDLIIPKVTVIILAVSQWLVSPAGVATLAAVAGIVAVLVAGPRLFPTSVGGWLNDRFGAVFGRSTAIAQFARFLADLLEAGVDAPSALRIAGYASRRPRLRAAGWSFARALDAGVATTTQPDQRPLTETVLHALRIDMPMPSRVRLLKEISTCYADRMNNRLSWTQGAIQPLAIGLIGGFVLLVVIALFAPLADLISNLNS